MNHKATATRFLRQRILLALGLMSPVLWALTAPVAAQRSPGEGSRIALMPTVTGPYTRPISTKSAESQAYFDQGLQFLYAFTMTESLLSFQEARDLDPECAMCWFGEAWSLGPYLNGAMRPGNAPLAYAAIQKALENSGSASPVERAMIEAMAVRYKPEHDPVERLRLDTAYSKAMEAVYRRYPRDLEVGTLYAESVMLLNTRRGTYDVNDPHVQQMHRILEAVLAIDLEHTGACHLYVHATEATPKAIDAAACADYLGRTVPGSSHINHMPSHTYNRIGRWGDAVRANIDAWHSDQRAAWGEGVSYATTHNLHMLLYAASMDGQGAVAAQAARDYAKLVRGGSFYHTMVLVRFGRFDEVLEQTTPPEQGLNRGLWDFSRGYAHLRQGNADSAAHYLRRVEEAAGTLPANTQMRGHTAAQLLGITGGILKGEILRAQGQLNEAIAAFQRAVEIQDGLAYDEPEPLVFSPRHWLGAALLEAGRPADAERVYLAALDEHPHNGWSLFGLEQALRAQGPGRAADAAQAQERFKAAWVRSDTLLRASRF
jgi:tetratricopeptide (TPR) repeat protein